MLVNEGKDIIRANEDLETVYKRYKDKDGFLYVFYTEEKVFGWEREFLQYFFYNFIENKYLILLL